VGYLDEMRRCDPDEGFSSLQREFAAVNRALRAAGAPEHEEPARIRGGSWSFKLYPSNGIAFLQRLAAYCNDTEVEEWPAPGDPETMDNPLEDEVVADVYALVDVMTFQHLILHEPKWGYWVPVDFRAVIFPDEDLGVGTMLGSSIRLKAECEKLARVLRLPLDLDPEDEVVRDAMFHPGRGRARWKKYGVESHNLLALYQACQKSVATGSAIYLD
jgi:hypothetical protein